MYVKLLKELDSPTQQTFQLLDVIIFCNAMHIRYCTDSVLDISVESGTFKSTKIKITVCIMYINYSSCVVVKS